MGNENKKKIESFWRNPCWCVENFVTLWRSLMAVEEINLKS